VLLLQLVGLRLGLAVEATSALRCLLCRLQDVLLVCAYDECVCVLLLQLVGPRLSLALEATSALRCLLEGSSSAQQEAAAAGAAPLLVQVRRDSCI
jgi:hypothetical protein